MADVCSVKNCRLSRRLRVAAGLVRPGAAVADVGCDHGKLAAWLILQNRASRVIATDIHPQPLEKARALFARLSVVDRAETVLCDGLAGVAPGAVEDVVVAGLGADTISAVIAAAAWLKDPEKRLILVPASHHERLRAALYAGGFALLSETAVCEAGHCYSVMHAAWCGNAEKIGPGFAAVGLLRGDTEDARAYLNREKMRAEALAGSDAPANKRAQAGEILRWIQEVLP